MGAKAGAASSGADTAGASQGGATDIPQAGSGGSFAGDVQGGSAGLGGASSIDLTPRGKVTLPAGGSYNVTSAFACVDVSDVEAGANQGRSESSDIRCTRIHALTALSTTLGLLPRVIQLPCTARDAQTEKHQKCLEFSSDLIVALAGERTAVARETSHRVTKDELSSSR